MTKHFWYVAEWLQKEPSDGGIVEYTWVPRKCDVIGPSMKEARYMVSRHYINDKAEYMHLSLTKIGDEAQYLESQGQLTIEFNSLDPYSSSWQT